MLTPTPWQSVTPLGDQAALCYFADERAALGFAARLRAAAPAWLLDVVQAYTSVGLYFDPDRTGYAGAVAALPALLAAAPGGGDTAAGRSHVIPCCYDFPLDLPRIAKHTGRTVAEVIRLHTGAEYTVYAVGFCPGFPYLGYLPPELAGVPRLETPRLRVEAGTVGLTGRQTGIYTQLRPGGWNLVGKTPLCLVDVADEYFPLRTGDRVRFRRIDEAEYTRLEGERL